MSAQEELRLAFSDPDVLCLGQADMDLTPVVIDANQSVIFTGATGGGKTTGLRLCALQEAMKRRTGLIAFDSHNQCLALGGRLTAHWSSLEEQVEGVRKLDALLKRRLSAFRSADEAGLVTDNSSWDSGLDSRIVLLVDEIAGVMATLKSIDQEALRNRERNWAPLVNQFARIVSEGRKLGFVVIATTTKFTNALAGDDPRIPIGLPTGVMLRPTDPQHAKLGLYTDDSNSDELDPRRWLRPGHAATYGAHTRTISSGLIRFQMPLVEAYHLKEAASRALEQGVWVPDEKVLLEPSRRVH